MFLAKNERFTARLKSQRIFNAIIMLFTITSAAYAGENAWIQRGFDDFIQGRFEDSGVNIYVNANGVIETINRLDVNNDGYVDIPIANSHDYTERGQTHIFRMENGRNEWELVNLPTQVPTDSGWKSTITDIDGDGYNDILVMNGENGVTSNLPSYIYWGSPEGIGAERTDLPTLGGYGGIVIDINRDERLDIIFSSAWEDHHNAGSIKLAKVYLGGENRKFTNATGACNIKCMAAVNIEKADLNHDGFEDIIIVNYREEHNYDINSYIYWGTADGINTETPFLIPTNTALEILPADLNQDGWEDLVFSGGNRVQIYWNQKGTFSPEHQKIIEAPGFSSMYCFGKIACASSDIDNDGIPDLIMTTKKGLEIRSTDDLDTIKAFLPITNTDCVTACDLDDDGLDDLIVSRYSDGILYDCESSVFWNSPDGFSMERTTSFPTGGAVGNTAGDIDGDGKPEIIFNNTMSGHEKAINKYIYLGDKNGTYTSERRIDLPTDGSTQCAIADLDLDGHPEVIFTEGITSVTGWNSFISIYKGSPEGPHPDDVLRKKAYNGLFGVFIADFNRDGYLDLLIGCQVYDFKPESLLKSAGIYYGSKNGFAESEFEPIESSTIIAFPADVNKDGYLDIIFHDKRDVVTIYFGSEDGFSKELTSTIPLPEKAGIVGFINCADINKDEWLDIIVTVMVHYRRDTNTMYVLYGSPNGYSTEDMQVFPNGTSPHHSSVADLNNDGNLDLVLSNYSSPVTRTDPSFVFWGDGNRLDLEHPLLLPTCGSCGILTVDMNYDGLTDIFFANHRDNIGHQPDSMIYWNSPDGFSTDNTTRIKSLGPHGTACHNHGNIYTRKPEEAYISIPFDISGKKPKTISWEANVIQPAALKFQLRWSDTKRGLETAAWMGSKGENTYYKNSGEKIKKIAKKAKWLQYRAVFVSPYSCRSPKLREVRIDYISN